MSTTVLSRPMRYFVAEPESLYGSSTSLSTLKTYSRHLSVGGFASPKGSTYLSATPRTEFDSVARSPLKPKFASSFGFAGKLTAAVDGSSSFARRPNRSRSSAPLRFASSSSSPSRRRRRRRSRSRSRPPPSLDRDLSRLTRPRPSVSSSSSSSSSSRPRPRLRLRRSPSRSLEMDDDEEEEDDEDPSTFPFADRSRARAVSKSQSPSPESSNIPVRFSGTHTQQHTLLASNTDDDLVAEPNL
jgi:hypothetical protein